MTRTHGAALAILILASMTGCSATHAAAASTGDTTQPADPSSGDKAGAGHISLTGQYSFEHDFTVEACSIAPAGDGLLSGYHMQSKDADPPVGLFAVALKEYAKDGPYDQASTTPEATAGHAMTSGITGPLTMMVLTEPTSPMAFMQVPDSKLTITISNDGAKGVAEFTDLESQPTAADIDPKSSGPPHGKRVSGSITWTCGTVGRINPTMNNAVNGAFNKLMPH